MTIADRKVELIEWVARLQDQVLLEKVEQLKQQAISETHRAGLEPMSDAQYKARLDQAEAEYQRSQVSSQEDLERESEDWWTMRIVWSDTAKADVREILIATVFDTCQNPTKLNV